MEEEITIGKRDIIKETEIEIIDLNKNMSINKKKDTYCKDDYSFQDFFRSSATTVSNLFFKLW